MLLSRTVPFAGGRAPCQLFRKKGTCLSSHCIIVFLLHPNIYLPFSFLHLYLFCPCIFKLVFYFPSSTFASHSPSPNSLFPSQSQTPRGFEALSSHPPPMRHTQRGTSHIHTFESTSRFVTDTHKHQSLCLIPLSPITIPFPDVPRPMRESPPIPPKIIK